MNVLLLQNDLCIRDMSENVVKSFPKSSVVDTSGDSFPSSPPVLSDKWLVRVRLGRSFTKQIMNVKKAEHVADFLFLWQGDAGEVLATFADNGVEISVVDNKRPDPELMVAWVMERLGVSEPVATHIVRRSNKYEPLVIKNTNMLAMLHSHKMTRTEVNKYLMDSSGVGFGYLYKYVLTGEGDYERVVQLVGRYRHSSAICTFVTKSIQRDIKLFTDIMDGELTKSNHAAYAASHKQSLYAVQQCLLMYDKVTLETLYAKLILFESLKGRSCVEFILKGCKL